MSLEGLRLRASEGPGWEGWVRPQSQRAVEPAGLAGPAFAVAGCAAAIQNAVMDVSMPCGDGLEVVEGAESYFARPELECEQAEALLTRNCIARTWRLSLVERQHSTSRLDKLRVP